MRQLLQYYNNLVSGPSPRMHYSNKLRLNNASGLLFADLVCACWCRAEAFRVEEGFGV